MKKIRFTVETGTAQGMNLTNNAIENLTAWCAKNKAGILHPDVPMNVLNDATDLKPAAFNEDYSL